MKTYQYIQQLGEYYLLTNGDSEPHILPVVAFASAHVHSYSCKEDAQEHHVVQLFAANRVELMRWELESRQELRDLLAILDMLCATQSQHSLRYGRRMIKWLGVGVLGLLIGYLLLVGFATVVLDLLSVNPSVDTVLPEEVSASANTTPPAIAGEREVATAETPPEISPYISAPIPNLEQLAGSCRPLE